MHLTFAKGGTLDASASEKLNSNRSNQGAAHHIRCFDKVQVSSAARGAPTTSEPCVAPSWGMGWNIRSRPRREDPRLQWQGRAQRLPTRARACTVLGASCAWMWARRSMAS